MKRFAIRLNGATKVAGAVTVPPAAELVENMNVKWTDDQHGSVDEDHFFKLKHMLEDTGFYLVFDDTPLHTH